MTLQTPFSHLAPWNSAEASQASLVLGLQVLPLMLLPHQNRQMFELDSAYVVPCTLCLLDVQGLDCTFPTRKVVALHPAPLYYQTLPMLGILTEWCLLFTPHAPEFQGASGQPFQGSWA